MLRIDQRREGETTVVHVEGRVAGPWVEELRRVLSSCPGARSSVTLDLAGVGYVDAAGEQVLRRAVADGARILGRSAFVAALLEADPSWEAR